jgi:2-polyprenyl-3-methyl-5-hydroxy-6-metoxy-1,4-benzoquinol methylase
MKTERNIQRTPSPEFIMSTMTAYERSWVLKAAIELDVFTSIGQGAGTPAQISTECHASEHGIRVLTDYLVTIGLLRKRGIVYSLSPESATYLDRRSQSYIGNAIGLLLSPSFLERFRDITTAVRQGGGVGNTLASEDPAWLDYARSMAPLMLPAAQAIAGFLAPLTAHPCKVLDVAAGHGVFGITVAQTCPQASLFAVDWSGVLGIAQKNAANAGIADRFSGIAGDAFAVEFGTDYDVVIIANFLHHFGRDECEILLGKVRSALKPGGRAVVVDFVLNGDRVSPPASAMFGITMLVTTPSGQCYTFEELNAMLTKAGFLRTTLHRLPMPAHEAVIGETQ